jgi:oxygen-independent coproporphyrinogen-3 oxidase
MDAILCYFDLAVNAEITMEANPGTVMMAALEKLRGLGINRISFGAQSANGEELRMLERTHSFLDVIEAVTSARRAGFDNLNLDLIYGLPEQRLETWKTTVARVLDLRPEHLSAYALTLEHGTPFGRWSARGLLPMPDPDAAAEMYEWASEALEAAGYEQYEISNWASVDLTRLVRREVGGDGLVANGQLSGTAEEPTLACRHNLQYWRGLPYLGLGAGAHGYANGYRYSNALRIRTYIGRLADDGEWSRWNLDPGKEGESIGARHGGMNVDNGARRFAFPLSPGAVNQHRQTAQDEMSEFMITGLRLTAEGIEPTTFRERFGRDLMETYGREIDELKRVGLLESMKRETSAAGVTSEVLRLTKRGRLLGNQVFMRFV